VWHAEKLQMLAEGVSYDGLWSTAPQQMRQDRRDRRAKRVASEIALPLEATCHGNLAAYSRA